MTKPIELLSERRGHAFYPTADEVAEWPKMYETDDSGPIAERIVHAHYFTSGGDWFLMEYDPETLMAFGWADMGSGELGYFHLPELESLSVMSGLIIVERDLHWKAKPAGECIPALKARA